MLHITDAIRVHANIFPGLKETRIIIDKESPTGKLLPRMCEQKKSEAYSTLLNPRNRIRAYHDPDFEALREDPEHAGIFAAAE